MTATKPPAGLRYPAAPTADQVDDYHGTEIRDPYRPLEDADAPASRAWIAAENQLTEDVLERSPARMAIRRRLMELWAVPRAGAPWRRGNRWFQLRNAGLQEQDVLWTADGASEQGRVLLDPNEIDREGTTALGGIAVSESGELVAAAMSHAGSDWHRWRVRSAATGDDLPDRIDWSKFSSAAWTHDDAGFFYGRFAQPPDDATYEAPNRDMELRYHRLDTDPASDPLVFSTPHQPEWGFEPEVSDDGRVLIVTIWRGADPENRVYVAVLDGTIEDIVVRPLLDKADAGYWHVATVDRTMYLRTDLGAPLGRVIAIDLDEPGTLREVIGEGGDTIEGVKLVGNRLAVETLHDAHHRLTIHELDGRPVTEVELPGIGTIGEMAGRRDDEELFLTFMTFASPPSVLAVRMTDGKVRAVDGPELAWNPHDF